MNRSNELNNQPQHELLVGDVPTSGFMFNEFMEAAATKAAYDSGERQVDYDWIRDLISDPKRNPIVTGMVRSSFLSIDLESDALADQEAQPIMNSFHDPEVVLTDKQTKVRDHVCRMLDQLRPYIDGEVDSQDT